jgi:hypothetical protein
MSMVPHVKQAEVVFPLPPETRPGDDIPLPAAIAKRHPRAVSSAGLTPTFEFHEPGDWCSGRLMRVRLGVGQNASRMYVLNTENCNMENVPAIVSVWGSTILDDRMESGDVKVGSVLFIQYLGTIDTKRAQNPAKDFRVLLL